MRHILISIIRHGQTDCNLRGVLQGQMETSLNATGREEAEKLGVRLKSETYTHVHSSNMERAEETARIVLRNNDFMTENGNGAQVRRRVCGTRLLSMLK